MLVLGALVFRSTRPQPLASPNGYDDFVKAGRMLTQRLSADASLLDYRAMSVEELRTLVLTNAEALRIARSGLGHECRVPIQNTAD